MTYNTYSTLSSLDISDLVKYARESHDWNVLSLFSQLPFTILWLFQALNEGIEASKTPQTVFSSDVM